MGHTGGETISHLVKAFPEWREFLVSTIRELDGVKISKPKVCETLRCNQEAKATVIYPSPPEEIDVC
ncbi:putative transaminase [Helianthus anomalus]